MNVLIWLLPKNELYAAIESVSCQIISLMLPVPFPSNCDSINNFLQTLRLPMPRHSPIRINYSLQILQKKKHRPLSKPMLFLYFIITLCGTDPFSSVLLLPEVLRWTYWVLLYRKPLFSQQGYEFLCSDRIPQSVYRMLYQQPCRRIRCL